MQQNNDVDDAENINIDNCSDATERIRNFKHGFSSEQNESEGMIFMTVFFRLYNCS